jgi:hypothetical protein
MLALSLITKGQEAMKINDQNSVLNRWLIKKYWKAELLLSAATPLFPEFIE